MFILKVIRKRPLFLNVIYTPFPYGDRLKSNSIQFVRCQLLKPCCLRQITSIPLQKTVGEFQVVVYSSHTYIYMIFNRKEYIVMGAFLVYAKISFDQLCDIVVSINLRWHTKWNCLLSIMLFSFFHVY